MIVPIIRSTIRIQKQITFQILFNVLIHSCLIVSHHLPKECMLKMPVSLAIQMRKYQSESINPIRILNSSQ